VHNRWTTGANWGRHADVLGTSCGRSERSKILCFQGLCSSSPPTRHAPARRNDGPPGGRPAEPQGPGDRAEQGVRREPLAVGPEVGHQLARAGSGHGAASRRTVTMVAAGDVRGGDSEHGGGPSGPRGPRGSGRPGRAPARAAGNGVRDQVGRPPARAGGETGPAGPEGNGRTSDRKVGRAVGGTGTVTRPPASPTCRGPRSMFGHALPAAAARHAQVGHVTHVSGATLSDRAGCPRRHLADLIRECRHPGRQQSMEVRGAACARTSDL
jgi:hypothetical protein